MSQDANPAPQASGTEPPPAGGGSDAGQHSSRRGSVARRLLGFLGFTVLGGAVGAMFHEEVIRTFDRLRTPSLAVAVVMSERTVDFGIPREFVTGFKRGMNNSSQITVQGSADVKIEYLEDGGDIEQARRQAREIIKDDAYILVVGNSNSTLTAATLDVFLESDDPPAYLLPIATASDLLVRARDGKHDGVLRMVPDNDDQAEQVQRLVAKIAPDHPIAILADEENPVYSINLSRAVASKIREKGGGVFVEQSIGPSHPSTEILRSWIPAKGDARRKVPAMIVYVGLAHHGMLLVDQMVAADLTAALVFTDGNMERSLIEHVGKQNVEAYILSPVALTNGESILPTYEPIGQDAAQLVNVLVNACRGCGRRKMREYIKTQRYAGSLELPNGEAGAYLFDAVGQNKKMSYHAYRILPEGRLEEIQL